MRLKLRVSFTSIIPPFMRVAYRKLTGRFHPMLIDKLSITHQYPRMEMT